MSALVSDAAASVSALVLAGGQTAGACGAGGGQTAGVCGARGWLRTGGVLGDDGVLGGAGSGGVSAMTRMPEACTNELFTVVNTDNKLSQC